MQTDVPAPDRDPRLWTLVSVMLAALIGVRLLWHLASGAGMYWDFVNFYDAGRRVAGLRMSDLYAAAEPLFNEPRLPDGVLTYVGFPLSAVVFAPLGWFGPRAALVLFKAACSLAGLAGTFILVRHLWRTEPGRRPHGAALALVLVALLVWEPFWFALTVGGQATLLAFPLLAGAFVLHARHRDVPAGLCLALAVLLKPVLAPMGVVLLLARAWPLIASTVLSGLALALLSLVSFGLPLHLQWVHAVMQESARWEMPWWINAALTTPVMTPWVDGTDTMRAVVPMPPLASNIALIARLLAAALIVWRGWRMTQYASPGTRREQTFVLGLTLSLCASNVIWSHYLVFVLLPWLLLAARLPRLAAPQRAFVLLLLLSVARASFPIARGLQTAIPLDTVWGQALAALAGSGTLMLLLAGVAVGVFEQPAVRLS